MKLQRQRFFQTLIAAAVTAAAMGCSTPGRSSAAKATSAVEALRQRFATGEQQVNATVASLANLVNNPRPDLRPPYKMFLENLNLLEAQIKKGQDDRTALISQADAYFAKWEQDTQKLQNQEIAQAAAARRDVMKASFDRIKEEIKTAKPTFDTFMRDLREINKALDFDLTPGGLTAIRPIVAKVQDEATQVKAHIATIRFELGRVSNELTAAAPSRN